MERTKQAVMVAVTVMIMGFAGGCSDVTLHIDDPEPGHTYLVGLGEGTAGEFFTEVPGGGYEVSWPHPVVAGEVKIFDLQKDGVYIYPGTIEGWNVNVQVNTPNEPNGPFACDYFGGYAFVLNEQLQVTCPPGGNPIP